MDTLIVVNPVSGGGSAKRSFLRFYKLLGQGDVVVSTKQHYILEHYNVFCGKKHIYIFGGDGTVNEVVNSIYMCPNLNDVYITIVPSGSGNDFVRSLPYSRFIRFFPGVFEWQGGIRYFVNAMGTGIDAYTAFYASEVKGRYLKGMAAYGYGLAKTMILGSQISHVDASNINIPDVLSIMSFGRGMYVGGGFKLLPHASVLDKTVSWLVAEPLGALELLINIRMLFDGSVTSYHKVHYGYSNMVEIALKEPKVFHVDGEIIRGVSTFSVYTADTPVWVRYIKPIY